MEEIQDTTSDFINELGHSLDSLLVASDEAIPESSEPSRQPDEAPTVTPILDVFIDDSKLRFSGAPWFDKVSTIAVTHYTHPANKVLIGGVGGIGSFVALFLSRTGLPLIIVDPDIVDTVNLAGQFFKKSDVGLSKIRAVHNFITQYTVIHVESYNSRITSTSIFSSKVMISCFDNMNARKDLFNLWKTNVNKVPTENRKEYLFIDGRLSAESYQIFCIPGNNLDRIAKYESEYLFSDEEADQVVCSYKQTTYMAGMIGSKMTMYVINFLNNSIENTIPRMLPFLDELDNNETYYKITM